VLAGHSYGVAVITNAAVGNPNVKALVYVNAFIPDAGDTVLALATAVPGSQIGGDPTTVFDFVPYPGATPGDVDLYIKPGVFVPAFGNDASPRSGPATCRCSRSPTPSRRSSGEPRDDAATLMEVLAW
jgi:pimeloyl-ACP methyl ester carboxylesterase